MTFWLFAFILNDSMTKIYISFASIKPYGFVKKIASEKYNICENGITLLKAEHGKPYFKELPQFHFNISHSADLCLIAVSDSPVGIDTEKPRQINLNIAKRFCKEEFDYISERDSENRFFEIWTKKEAYLKYKGLGLSGGLDTFNVLNPDIPIATFEIDGYTVSLCSFDKDFSTEYIK